MPTKQIIIALVFVSVASSFLIPKQAIDDNIKPKSNQEIPTTKQGKLMDIMGETGNSKFYNNMDIDSHKPKVAYSESNKKETIKITDSIKVEAQEAEPVKEKVTEVVKLVEAPKVIPKSNLINNDFITTASELGVSVKLAQAMQNAADKYSINPRYLLAVGLTENALAPNEIGDRGCSYGVYQVNTCVHKTTSLNPSIIDCAKDFDCSSEWTAYRIRHTYCQSTTCSSWIGQLSMHNGFVGVPQWYKNKISKNGLLSGLTF